MSRKILDLARDQQEEIERELAGDDMEDDEEEAEPYVVAGISFHANLAVLGGCVTPPPTRTTRKVQTFPKATSRRRSMLSLCVEMRSAAVIVTDLGIGD